MEDKFRLGKKPIKRYVLLGGTTRRPLHDCLIMNFVMLLKKQCYNFQRSTGIFEPPPLISYSPTPKTLLVFLLILAHNFSNLRVLFHTVKNVFDFPFATYKSMFAGFSMRFCRDFQKLQILAFLRIWFSSNSVFQTPYQTNTNIPCSTLSRSLHKWD